MVWMFEQDFWECNPELQISMRIILWSVHLPGHVTKEFPTSVKSMPQPSDVMKRTVLMLHVRNTLFEKMHLVCILDWSAPVDNAQSLNLRACFGVPTWRQTKKPSKLTASSICTSCANQRANVFSQKVLLCVEKSRGMMSLVKLVAEWRRLFWNRYKAIKNEKCLKLKLIHHASKPPVYLVEFSFSPMYVQMSRNYSFSRRHCLPVDLDAVKWSNANSQQLK